MATQDPSRRCRTFNIIAIVGIVAFVTQVLCIPLAFLLASQSGQPARDGVAWHVLWAGLGLGIVSAAATSVALEAWFADCGSTSLRVALRVFQVIAPLGVLLSLFLLIVSAMPRI